MSEAEGVLRGRESWLAGTQGDKVWDETFWKKKVRNKGDRWKEPSGKRKVPLLTSRIIKSMWHWTF